MDPSILMEVQEPWFTLIKEGFKTVEGRTGSFEKIKSKLPPGKALGDIIALVRSPEGKEVKINITGIVHYDDLESYLEGEDWEKCAPHASSKEEARAKYLEVFTKEGEQVFSPSRVKQNGGINAIRLELR